MLLSIPNLHVQGMQISIEKIAIEKKKKISKLQKLKSIAPYRILFMIFSSKRILFMNRTFTGLIVEVGDCYIFCFCLFIFLQFISTADGHDCNLLSCQNTLRFFHFVEQSLPLYA